ncbi:MAG TPA: MarR family winged helix-turn-helix transcriptional regulator [Bacillota bacterium]|nr:MarR family winged helix-turn-helix transcriptional regulator [Bacillota bacterium]HOK69053.1 MarR family winged helix-turn-helix transcriptional regulator [Bacillota bacterium]HPP85830.1 MarR family winged helix-turn-helix transcriptional regulator [Bacillota bacterium]
MRNEFDSVFNQLLVDTFNSLTKIEENSLQSRHDIKLSISEYHLLESVGKGYPDGITISEIAADLGITTASVTIGVNKLVKKGLVEKVKSSEDGRYVLVKLTREGRRINAGHKLFHLHLVRSLRNEFDAEELDVLKRCFEKINAYFKKYGEAGKKD